MPITLKEMAEKLNGITYDDCLYKLHDGLAVEAKENGIVICTGASDDLVEFDGAIYDEGDCFDGGDVYFDKDSIAQNGEELPNKITVIWCGMVDGESAGPDRDFQTEDGETIAWCYQTDIPHETFMVYEYVGPYCRGIVFLIEDLK